MGSGSCTYRVPAGDTELRCACPHGMFTIQSEAPISGNEECLKCTHPLSQHKDESSDSTQDVSESKFPVISPPILVIFLQPVANLTEPHSTLLRGDAISPRDDTVIALWEQVQENSVIHVRGTPTSGKSMLAILLHEHVQHIPGMDVIRFFYMASGRPKVRKGAVLQITRPCHK
jgi:hypothetical protein